MLVESGEYRFIFLCTVAYSPQEALLLRGGEGNPHHALAVLQYSV